MEGGWRYRYESSNRRPLGTTHRDINMVTSLWGLSIAAFWFRPFTSFQGRQLHNNFGNDCRYFRTLHVLPATIGVVRKRSARSKLEAIGYFCINVQRHQMPTFCVQRTTNISSRALRYICQPPAVEGVHPTKLWSKGRMERSSEPPPQLCSRSP